MTGRDPELEQFLEVLSKLLGTHAALGASMGDPERAPALERTLSEAGVLDLAVETLEMDGALRWLADVVRTTAHSSPSLALVLAAQYVAHRAISLAPGQSSATTPRATAGLIAPLDLDGAASSGIAASVPRLFGPEVMVLLHGGGVDGVIVHRDATVTEPDLMRTGLAESGLCTVRVVGDPSARLDAGVASAAVHELTLLTAAAALGVAEAASKEARTYAEQRRQFGSSLLSFAGIRAMLVEMQLRVAIVAALLDQALDSGTAESCLELASTAGRASVDVALDAIQVHGGYGYIDEYPVAGLLRDALSLRARTARRSSVRRLAVEQFGTAG